MKMKLSVVIPARNEAASIGVTLDGLVARLEREGFPFEVIVVDDGSEDLTAEDVLARGRSDPRIRLVRNDRTLGFGRAVCHGLDAISGDAVVIVMADGSDDPDDVVTYYYVLRDRADCAFGSRWVRGAQVLDYPRVKWIINRLGNTVIRFLFGLRYNDTTNAFKGYRRGVIEGCRPFLSLHFNLTVEIPLKAIVRGYSYAVVPIRWRNRNAGRSQFSIEEMGSRYAYVVLNIWLEKLLIREDYRRSSGEVFRPWQNHETERSIAGSMKQSQP